VLEKMKGKVPEKHLQITVLGFVVFLVFSWSIFWFLYRLPSWTYYLGAIDILSIFAYSMASSLFESLVIHLIMVMFAVVLPTDWFGSKYGAQSAVTLLAVIFVTFFSLGSTNQFIWQLLFLLIIIISNILVIRLEKLNQVINTLVGRFDIFIYVYIPLGVIGVLVVIVRNILFL
jgi:hypothetical protein